MATYRLKTSGNHTTMEEISQQDKIKMSRKAKPVSVQLSRQILDKMKRDAGIRNIVSDSTILKSWIIKRLADGTI